MTLGRRNCLFHGHWCSVGITEVKRVDHASNKGPKRGFFSIDRVPQLSSLTSRGKKRFDFPHFILLQIKACWRVKKSCQQMTSIKSNSACGKKATLRFSCLIDNAKAASASIQRCIKSFWPQGKNALYVII